MAAVENSLMKSYSPQTLSCIYYLDSNFPGEFFIDLINFLFLGSTFFYIYGVGVLCVLFLC